MFVCTSDITIFKTTYTTGGLVNKNTLAIKTSFIFTVTAQGGTVNSHATLGSTLNRIVF